MKESWLAPEADRRFLCTLQNAWTAPEKVTGLVRRETWREVRLRGYVPILLVFREHRILNTLFDMGEHHLFLLELKIDGRIEELPASWEEDASFHIDWDRAIPERMAAEILRDEDLLASWRGLTYEEACDLIAPARRARSPRSVATRELEALGRLRRGSCKRTESFPNFPPAYIRNPPHG